MLRDGTSFAVVSDHEHWLFLSITEDNDVAVSPVYPVTAATPSLTATVYAILVGTLGCSTLSPAALDVPVATSVGSASLDQSDARPPRPQDQPTAQHNSSQDPAQADGREEAGLSSLTVSHANVRCHPSCSDTLLQLAEGPDFPSDLFIVIDSLQESSWSCPPKKLSLQQLKSYLRVQIQSFPMTSFQQLSKSIELFETHSSTEATSRPGSYPTTLGQSSCPPGRVSTCNLTPGYLPLSHALPGGFTATVFKVHGMDLVCKLFGPDEGTGEDREERDWLADFHYEAFAYTKVLQHLQGTAIPRCFGAYESSAASMAVLVLEHCGNSISHASASHELFRRQDQ